MMYGYPQSLEEGVESPAGRLTGSCELPHGSWEPNANLPQEQQMLFTLHQLFSLPKFSSGLL